MRVHSHHHLPPPVPSVLVTETPLELIGTDISKILCFAADSLRELQVGGERGEGVLECDVFVAGKQEEVEDGFGKRVMNGNKVFIVVQHGTAGLGFGGDDEGLEAEEDVFMFFGGMGRFRGAGARH